MRTDFSEFSYGYAVTAELMMGVFSGLNLAPIFPSLIEEGRAGGGYDVNINAPGRPLFIQFKRPDVMVRDTAAEISDGYNTLLGGVPFYRMPIRSHGTSQQHDLLLALDDGSCDVFYVTPCFHGIKDLNQCYAAHTVVSRSLWIKPSEIGPLSKEPHRVSYGKQTGAILYSKPRELKSRRFQEVGPYLGEQLESGMALEETLAGALSRVLSELGRRGLEYVAPDRVYKSDSRYLAKLADIAVSYLGVQLFIAQKADTQTSKT